MTQTHSLDVPGARLHYEVCGAGPLLLVIGSPMPAAGSEVDIATEPWATMVAREILVIVPQKKA